MINIGDLIAAISSLASEQDRSPLLVAICGAADLGKTRLSLQLVNGLMERGLKSSHIPLDSYLMERSKRHALSISGYQPEAYYLSRITRDIDGFLQGNPIEYSAYDHAEGKTLTSKVTINPCNILFLDGLHSMHECLRPYVNCSIFIHATDDLHLKIRHEADIKKRKQSVEFSKLNLQNELAAYKMYVEPYLKSADIVYQVNELWKA